jgi:hypothetical protein
MYEDLMIYLSSVGVRTSYLRARHSVGIRQLKMKDLCYGRDDASLIQFISCFVIVARFMVHDSSVFPYTRPWKQRLKVRRVI